MDMYRHNCEERRRGEGTTPPSAACCVAAKTSLARACWMLNGSVQIFVSKFHPILPSEEELRLALQRDREAIEMQKISATLTAAHD